MSAEASLRAWCGVGENRRCFECGQRGPTYVDVTIGSFVCSRCSGLLRGLAPPHRVKSISMAAFADGEVDFVRAKGNARCRETWMALYEGGGAPVADQTAMLDFLKAKYETKAYYAERPSTRAPVPTPAAAAPPPTPSGPFGMDAFSEAPFVPRPTPPATRTMPTLPASPALPTFSAPAAEPQFRADFSSADIFDSSPFSAEDAFNANAAPARHVQNAAASPDRYAALADLDSTLRQQNQREETAESRPSYNPFDSIVQSDNPKNPFRTNVNGNIPGYDADPVGFPNPFTVRSNVAAGRSKNPFL